MTAHRRLAFALACCLPLASCGGQESLTVAETKERYAKSILDGAPVGAAWTVSADSFYTSTGTLVNVRMDDADGKYYAAERASIIVDPVRDTVALRLENVVMAHAQTDDASETSGVFETASVVTEPVRVPYDVRP
ncbi:MAG: hypothetical protein AAGH64_09895 [Planctomycetota bacterium]